MQDKTSIHIQNSSFFSNILLSLAKCTDVRLSYMALTVFSLWSWIVQTVKSTVERTTFFSTSMVSRKVPEQQKEM